MVPAFVNQTIIQLKNTSLASIVTVPELVFQAQYVSGITYRPLEMYTAIAVLYFVLAFGMSKLSQRLELQNGSRRPRRRKPIFRTLETSPSLEQEVKP